MLMDASVWMEVRMSQELIGLCLYLILTYIDADFAHVNDSFGPMSETDKLRTNDSVSSMNRNAKG